MGKNYATEYWRLVHQLSLLGWYRSGRDGNGAPGRAAWRFHAGHTTDTAHVQIAKERCVAARSEIAAMRALLRDLRRGPGATRSAPPDGMQKMQHDISQVYDASILWRAPRAPHHGGRPR